MKRDGLAIIVIGLLTLVIMMQKQIVQADSLQICPLDPFAVNLADELNEEACSTDSCIMVRGFINDWLLAAVKVTVRQEMTTKVDFTGNAELTGAIELCVIGEVLVKDKWYLDPVFKQPQALGDLSKFIGNWKVIYEFPKLHLIPNKSVLILLTIKTHTLSPGKKSGFLTFSGQNKLHHRIPVTIEIHPVKLPEDNPIIGHTWATYKEDEELARLVKEYGINACGYYDNWDMLRRLGFRFFRFSFPLSNWHYDSLKVEDDEIQEYLNQIKETVTRLNLMPEEWAIEIFDEPFDGNAWIFVAWAIRIKRLWQEARIYANPGYSWTNKNFATVAHTIEPLKHYVDVWCPYEEYRGQPEFMDALRKTGRPIWFYTIEFSHNKPRRGGRQIPWLAWRLKLDGWAFYNLKDESEKVWTDNVCARMYPGNTMSLWMEGLRQGVQDYKRLWVLKNFGVSDDEITSAILRATPPGEEHPWGGSEPETYARIRHLLDDLLINKSQR